MTPDGSRACFTRRQAIGCSAVLLCVQASRHPLIVIGAGANRKMTSNMLRQFVDEIGMPFCEPACLAPRPSNESCRFPPMTQNLMSFKLPAMRR